MDSLPARHTTSLITRIRFFAVLVTMTMLIASPSHATVTSVQIRGWVTGHINDELAQRGITSSAKQQVTVKISSIDSRLRLADCNTPVRIETSSNRWIGRVNSKVSCEGPAPWSIYVPVQIRLSKQVVVAITPLPRGHLVTAKDVGLLQIDITDYPRGHFDNPEAVIGKELKRAVAMNNPIAPAHLQQALAIKRGDEVMIVAANGHLAIRSPGIAMSDGRVGQQIRVKNKSSKRVIKARVMERGLVKVLI